MKVDQIIQQAEVKLVISREISQAQTIRVFVYHGPTLRIWDLVIQIEYARNGDQADSLCVENTYCSCFPSKSFKNTILKRQSCDLRKLCWYTIWSQTNARPPLEEGISSQVVKGWCGWDRLDLFLFPCFRLEREKVLLNIVIIKEQGPE